MENLNKKSILSHLDCYHLAEQDQSLLKAGLMPILQIEGTTIRLIFSGDSKSISLLAAEQKKLSNFLKEKIPHGNFQILLNSHVSTANTPHNPPKKRPAPPEKIALPHIKNLIAVASGKGGVGKSMVAVNLALALHKQGLKVGLLDLDIYGPSVPALLNLQEVPQKEKGHLVPLQYHGMPVLSMGFLIPPEKAVIWRGPLIQKTVSQFLVETAWPDLDILILDTPPGTGDVHLSLAQSVPLSGAIVVSTPQKLAILDARKSIEMFETLQIPVLGVVENMSTYTCSACDAVTPLFDSKSFKELQQEKMIPLLAQIPFDQNLQQSAEKGTPLSIDAAYGAGPLISLFQNMAKKVSDLLSL